MKRQRRLMLAAASAVTLQGLSPVAAAQGRMPLVTVWKGPTCGCCKDWVRHLEDHGFEVRTQDTGSTDARHTAQVGGYAVEGHVPAREMKRLLKERPAAVGLAVPAMPRGSPGMDGPEYGGHRDPYDVLLVRKDGRVTPYQTYR